MSRYKIDIIIGVVTFLLMAGLAYILYIKFMPGEPQGNITPAEQKTADSLDNTKTEFQHQLDSIRTLVIHDTVESTRLQEEASRTQARADRFQARADSLAHAIEIGQDSASGWKLAYEARTEEAAALRIDLVKKDSIIQVEHTNYLRVSAMFAADTVRRIAVENLNSDLRKTISGLVKPCKIGPLPCPSRKVIAASAYLLGKMSKK